MGWSLRNFVIEMIVLVAFASGGHAETPFVYHSPGDDGARSPSVPVEPGAPEVSLFLYLDAGGVSSSVGAPCVDGNGDELCGWELELQAAGMASIQSFIPDLSQDVVARTEPDRFVATGGDAIVGELGPIRLGELELDVSGNAWSVRLSVGKAIEASFALVNLETGVIAVPEPSTLYSLTFGTFFLLSVGRARRSRLDARTRSKGTRPSPGRTRSPRRARPARVTCAPALVLLLLTPGLAWAQDADSDGIPDVSDNCPHVPNPGQEDSGGLLGPLSDGIGDVCQCGDLNDDGLIDLLDAALYQRGLAGVLPVALDEDKCSVIGGRLDCEPNDRQALREVLVGIAPGLSQVCQAANAVPPPPTRIVAAGDSITQGFSADCTCNAGILGLICLLCPASGDQPEHSWFDGDELGSSFYDLYGGSGSGITANRVSMSGAEMTGGADSFSSQVDDVLSLVPIPDLVVVELGGNDVCNRGCVDPNDCGNPLYDDATWTAAVEAGLDKLVGFGHPTSLPPGSTIYLLGMPRVQDLHAAGVAKQQGTSSIDCESFWETFNVCEIATVDARMNGEDLAPRLAEIDIRVQRYNEILRDLALAYSTNSNGKNPGGIEVVSDYVNETIPSTGTTAFGPNEINGGDCFHPSLTGQALISAGAWFSNPR